MFLNIARSIQAEVFSNLLRLISLTSIQTQRVQFHCSVTTCRQKNQEENNNWYTYCKILFIRIFVYLYSIDDNLVPRSEETTKIKYNTKQKLLNKVN